MNTNDFTSLLNKPYSLTERQSSELEAVLLEFPYLQPARAILLKALYNKESYRYNSELKKTAAYTTDRSVLFDYITSENFQSIQKVFFEEKQASVGNIEVRESEPVQIEAISHNYVSPSAEALPESEPVIQEEIVEKPVTEETPSAEANLEIGKPLEFNQEEKHSFREWLQLSKMAPIKRDVETELPEPEVAHQDEATDYKSRKLELIDRFIEANPKIGPAKDAPPTPISLNAEHKDASYLMTETLARVYLEQKKYSRAIQAYEILILKYPEKSVFFADRISDIKLLQQNNNS
ncbi:MAG: tetratricopeptide repeat protein [Flavobacterium sp.]